MGKLLDKYSNELRSKVEGQATTRVIEENEKDPFARYREVFEKKQSFEVSFGMVDTDGTLSGIDQFGIKFILDGESLSKDLTYYAEGNKAKFIGVDFNVKIERIDEANGVIYVKSAYSNVHSTRQTLISEIMKELGSGNTNLVLPGRIVSVSEKRAMVDLLGKGILGFISVEKWQKGYVRHLPKVVKKNEVYDFLVVKPMPKKKNSSIAFRLSREEITEDPWVVLKRDNPGLGVDSIITVQCIAKPAGKSYWWGICPMVNGIEIMGDYTTSIRPYVGVVYRCKVTRFDPDNQKFQVAPFDVIDSPTGTKESIKFISSKKYNK